MTVRVSFAKRLVSIASALLIILATGHAFAKDGVPAKKLFGGKALPADMPAQAYGFYSKGCLSGGMAIATDGPYWQAMRLSRNRRWGHPQLINTIEKLARQSAQYDGWPGLLVGDISQPRGGPMLTGHASHQIGLDADIWLTPMPNRRFTYAERESTSAISVLKAKSVVTDPNIWTQAHGRLIMRAVSYPEVQRVLVHPGIKKKLCETWKGDRSKLNKVRPYYGHHYHMHVRLRCPKGSGNCRTQNAVPADSGCGAALDWWFDVALKPKKPSKKSKKTSKPKKKRQIMLGDLPSACAVVLKSADPVSEEAVTFRSATTARTAFAPLKPVNSPFSMPALVPIPKPRPFLQ
ncbi:MAG: penicillin-insensitive murein endopeptidase [Hyphomicrobiales bacterium]|nr:penicillin-insensitive murein endopeptidase [Hyphomicrobiales bacterium]MCP5001764.1 penicillin-insensitive murein endopeptidase [Hyphomicrobiales bacterium]